METKYYLIDRNQIDQDKIRQAAQKIQEGKLVVFPTETVYGLGADAFQEDAIKNVFMAKNRPMDNPLIVHIAKKDDFFKIVNCEDKTVNRLIDTFWPGPLTLVGKKQEHILDLVTAGQDTVAVRFPSDKIAQALIRSSNTYIVAPSANLSGKPSPTTGRDVEEDLNGKVSVILDGGFSNIGLESTVLDISREPFTILRPGYYTAEDFKELGLTVTYDLALVEDHEVPRSPGQKYRHYAPQAELSVYVGEVEKRRRVIMDEYHRLTQEGKKVALLLFDHGKDPLGEDVFSLGNEERLEEMAQKIFHLLREADRNNYELILAEGVEERGLGFTIMNRLKKSSEGRVYYL